MKTTFKTYLQNIKPTNRGTYILIAMFLVIPFIIDFFLLFVEEKMINKFSFTFFALQGFAIILIGLLIYHIAHFIAFSRKGKNKE